jgi:hypothetical protein
VGSLIAGALAVVGGLIAFRRRGQQTGAGGPQEQEPAPEPEAPSPAAEGGAS